MYYYQEGQNNRREQWFSKVREQLHNYINPDGTGKIPQFSPPWREVVWILPALYTGDQKMIDLANKMVAGFNSAPTVKYDKLAEQHGKQFGIFQSNTLANLLNIHGEKMTSTARDVAEWHARATFRRFDGSAQPDYRFHGANDNMPMMATCGLILGGEAIGNQDAVEHGLWNLHQLRRHLSRCAWISEYNSSTYSPITLAGAARIASHTQSEEIRQLALDIEQRIWAELLLHYHPGTYMQAGPHCRAYSIDNVGHNHSLQALLWMAFGPEKIGRDLIKSYFDPDGTEVTHFQGNYFQSVAEFCDMFDCELHLPQELISLIQPLDGPVETRGRTEMMGTYDGFGATAFTQTYMEDAFSLGTSTLPLCGGEQTNQLYATYRRKATPKTFRDSSSLFYRYRMDNTPMGELEASVDGEFKNEAFQKNMGWVYAIQHKNVALMHCAPNSKDMPEEIGCMKLNVIFPAHYGKIRRSIIGNASARDEAIGESSEPVPVSIETGEVLIHIQPLLPTNLPRTAALRFSRQNQYEVLELINYEGERRHFNVIEASRIFNGMVLTINNRSDYESLESFHEKMSDCRVLDELFARHRRIQFFREDVDFELLLTTNPFGVQSESINGRPIERPMFQTDRLDVKKLPFMTGKVDRNKPFYPWEKLDCASFEHSWMIGSRGLSPKRNYTERQEQLHNHV